MTYDTNSWFYSYFLSMCIRKTGDEWQQFVTDVFFARYAGAFIQVDPSFRGDKGCDGYVDGLMLACYGASRPTSKGVKEKIEGDLLKAKASWGDSMKRWAFVHNNAVGLPLAAAEAFVDLKAAETGPLILENWPPQVLWKQAVRHLDQDEMVTLFGAPPSERPAGMSYIADAVRHMARSPRIPTSEPAAPVPPGKIEYNDFAEETAQLIREYQVHTYLVRYYFDGANPGEQFHVSENLKAKYYGLVAELDSQDAVFHALCDELVNEAFSADANGDRQQRRSAAVLVITHFFESCLIFEAPDGVDVPA